MLSFVYVREHFYSGPLVVQLMVTLCYAFWWPGIIFSLLNYGLSILSFVVISSRHTVH